MASFTWIAPGALLLHHRWHPWYVEAGRAQVTTTPYFNHGPVLGASAIDAIDDSDAISVRVENPTPAGRSNAGLRPTSFFLKRGCTAVTGSSPSGREIDARRGRIGSGAAHPVGDELTNEQPGARRRRGNQQSLEHGHQNIAFANQPTAQPEQQ